MPRSPGLPAPLNDPALLKRLIEAARRARRRAYAPYSSFAVGAALLDSAGGIHRGCNVENASFGLTICAERMAVGRFVAEGEGKLVAAVIAAPREEPVSPCGACRQVLAEFNADLPVLCVGSGGRRRFWRLSDLLPAQFHLEPPPAPASGKAS